MTIKYTRQGAPWETPCLRATWRWLDIDADQTTWFPYGTCLGIDLGPRYPVPDSEHDIRTARYRVSLCLNGPLGCPNRLGIRTGGWNWTIGLVEWHTLQPVPGTEHQVRNVRCRPHLVRSQTWNRKTCRGGQTWRWITVWPADHRERWAARYPEEAKEADRRAAAWRPPRADED